ncbi:hypothetical protein SAMN05518871_105139 [Psychrobacillus sp. OK028]|uniref:hypothetical protein n=1 Tax=unclassified Psychrobacillus TaxID=2636677 RepID=UPI000881521E|nr:hypothetical protein [Psychrobacillus sp. OK028]SDN43575.1 hypothetical protein SAMN05518871_105139 [Psychrobacillus sp. OK028]
MLTFEEKEAIIQEFTELTRKEVSMKRVNYHYEKSLYEKTTVIYHLHPNGNGFVYVGDLPQYEAADDKGLLNIREASADELRKIIKDSITYLSTEEEELQDEEIEEVWKNKEDSKLTLLQEDTLWNIYHGYNLEESFGSYSEAKAYLLEEGFRLAEKK